MTGKAAPAPGSWFSPAPYVLAGLAPFTAGTLLAVASGLPLRPGVFFLGLVGVAALIKAAFAAREVFAPALGRCPSWRAWPQVEARRLAYLCLAVAALAAVAVALLALASCALARWPRKVGMAIAAKIPIMAMTIRSSIKVKPFLFK